jgi:hypothetical protein
MMFGAVAMLGSAMAYSQDRAGLLPVLITVVCVALFFMFAVTWVALYLTTTVLYVSATAIGSAGLVKRRSEVPIAEVAEVSRLSLIGPLRMSSRLYCARKSDRQILFCLSAPTWAEADLDKVWSRLKLQPVGSWNDTISNVSVPYL